jgi:translation initiation factor IF-2
MISNNSNFVSRAPVVTIMGHVDHGKTSLLDKIRNSRIAANEAGGITQHISAYTINKNGHDITFIDTPGHEAFKAMRMRGAKITDIIIIVIAADDGVKPQTIESIKAAKESGVPIIVAVNKMDKETANLDMVKSSMAEHNMTPVDWGGNIEFIPISAKTGAGIEDLLETIILQAELLELKADPTALCKAIVLEASTQKGRGTVATIIVQNGTLKVGDNIVADTTFGKVKAIINDQGKSVKELGLSCAGTVVGLANIPSTGVLLVAQNSINEAKEIATKRAQYARAKELSASTKVTLDEMAGLIAEGKIKALPVIIKADAGGSLEAIKSSLESIKNNEVKVKILSAGVGGITEADLSLANAGENTIILGFNVRPTGSVKTKAKVYGVEIKTYSIIYQLIDDIKDILSGMMSEIVTEENTGQAQVLETFVIPKIGTVAGTKVTDGKVIRGGLARVIRDGVVIYTGKIKSLKRFKDDAKEVANGFECGIIFENFNDIKIDDYIETFIEHRKLQSLD